MTAALVTGATGFIGSHLARRLVGEGRIVRLLIRDGSRLDPVLAERCECVQGALGDLQAMRRAVSGVGSVFHCAANVRTWSTPAAYEADNVAGVQNLLDAIAAERPPLTRLVHLSSVDVYGFPLQPCDENAPVGQTGFGYGDSKARGEALVREVGTASGTPWTILRPCNVLGPGSAFIDRIGAAMLSGVMLTVDGGRCNAGVLDVDNLVDAMLWAESAPTALHRCYNVRDDRDVTWAQFVDCCRSRFGRGRVIDLPFGTADLLARLAEGAAKMLVPAWEPPLHRLVVRIFGRTCGHSAARLRTDSGLACRVGHEESMRRSLDWFLSHR